MSTRDDYLTAIELQLQECDARLEELSDQTVEMNSYVRASYDEQLQALQVKRDAAYARLRKMRAAHESAWRQMRTEMDALWEALKSALNNVSSRFYT